MGRAGAREPRGRLLRDDARPYRGDRGPGRRHPAAPPGRAGAVAASVGARPAGDPTRRPVRQRGGADERHGLGPVPDADPRRGLRGRARGGAGPGRQRGPASRCEHGRGASRLRGRDGPVSSPDRERARHRPRSRRHRLLALGGDRGRTPVRPGQADRQLDLAQGGRRSLPGAGGPGAPVRGVDDRDGVRRGRPGGHAGAQDRDLRPGLPAAHGTGDPSRRHLLRSQRVPRGDRDSGARRIRDRVHRRGPLDQGPSAGLAHERRHQQRLVRLSR